MAVGRSLKPIAPLIGRMVIAMVAIALSVRVNADALNGVRSMQGGAVFVSCGSFLTPPVEIDGTTKMVMFM
jgi:hypothetical protein